MSALSRSLSSSIGRKYVVAISGLALLGFVLGHLTGNLLIFGGPDALNSYAEGLKKLGVGLWVMRGAVLAFFLLHVYYAVQLSLENKGARSQSYVKKTYQRATTPSRTMLISGGVLFAFILYHLAHFTFLVVNYTGPHLDSMGRHDVYAMVIAGFKNPVLVGLYVVAIAFLAMHLSHALPSVLQTIGVTSKRIECVEGWIGKAVAGIVFLGYVSIPISVMAGVLS